MYNSASCWLYLKEYIDDVRSHEHQKPQFFLCGETLDSGSKKASRTDTGPYVLLKNTSEHVHLSRETKIRSENPGTLPKTG
jgi:hypothetical protein